MLEFVGARSSVAEGLGKSVPLDIRFASSDFQTVHDDGDIELGSRMIPIDRPAANLRQGDDIDMALYSHC